jgi:preprotein translocase subunit SecD
MKHFSSILYLLGLVCLGEYQQSALAGTLNVKNPLTNPKTPRLCATRGTEIVVKIKKSQELKTINPKLLAAVKQVISKRITGLGLKDILIVANSRKSLTIQLPEDKNSPAVLKVLYRMGQLDFRSQKPNTEEKLQQISERNKIDQEQLAILQKNSNRDPKTLAKARANLQQSNKALINLFSPPQLTGKNLIDAQPQSTQTNESWNIAIKFDKAGGDEFAKLTKDLAGTGRSIGIFIDGVLVSRPLVDAQYQNTGILGGTATIHGNFNAQNANDLALVLQGGALPAPIEIADIRPIKKDYHCIDRPAR